MSSKKQTSSKRKYLPFFVYGTLLKGLHNYNRLLAGRNPHVQPATLTGHVLLAGRAAGFPYMAELEAVERACPTAVDLTGRVLGQVITVPEDQFEHVLDELDYLEGVAHDHYARKEVTANVGVGDKVVLVKAWAYYLQAKHVPALFHNPIIYSGSWIDHTTARGY